MFIPDDIRNALVDFSDYILSYETVKSIYLPIESVVDFLADDGYTYKYNMLPKSIVDRLDNEINSIDNTINLFLNNPLFETWIIPNLTSSDGILKETFKNYFSEEFYEGFSIYSSKMIEIFSLGIPKDENIKFSINSQKKISFFGDYLIIIRKLTKDLDFIDGYFVLTIDKNKFFNYILNDNKDDFELVYVVLGNSIIFTSKDVSISYLQQNLESEYLSLWGSSFKQITTSYEDIKVYFVLPNPSWVRWIFVIIKIIVLAGVFVFLFYINKMIKKKLKQAEDTKTKVIKELKKSFNTNSLPSSDTAINNILVKTTEENLKFFENFVQQDIKSLKQTKKTSIFR